MTGRLLILDDEADLAALIAEYATSFGFEARSSLTPNEFWHLVESWDPTHIVLDLSIPQVDGITLLRRLAENGCRAHIVLVSGLGGRVLDAAVRIGRERGLQVSGFLEKPFGRVHLREALEGASTWMPGGDAPPTDRQWRPTEADLSDALRNNEFRVALQPCIDGHGGVVGYEALLRWQHPERGMLPPAAFLDEIEGSDLLGDVTRTVLQMALAGARAGAIEEHERLAINLSPRSLNDLGLADDFARICALEGVDPGRIVVEITESAQIPEEVDALDIVTHLRVKGFAIAVDDFGTGYSSLRQLARLPFSILKVDRSFVGTLHEAPESRSIVQATIALAHELGLRVVAEGVEDWDTAWELRDLACDEFQGFCFATPMLPELLPTWRAGWSGWA